LGRRTRDDAAPSIRGTATRKPNQLFSRFVSDVRAQKVECESEPRASFMRRCWRQLHRLMAWSHHIIGARCRRLTSSSERESGWTSERSSGGLSVSARACAARHRPPSIQRHMHVPEFLLRFRFSATLACRGSRALPGAQRSRCQMGRVVTATGRVCLVTSSPTSTGLLGQSFRMRLSNQTS
jgi:hypothetical protein